MGIGESSMPSLLSFKEDSLCQKPSSTELCNCANCSNGSFLLGSTMVVSFKWNIWLSLIDYVTLQQFPKGFGISAEPNILKGFDQLLQSTTFVFVFMMIKGTCSAAVIGPHRLCFIWASNHGPCPVKLAGSFQYLLFILSILRASSLISHL